jgi:hypothetical protein
MKRFPKRKDISYLLANMKKELSDDLFEDKECDYITKYYEEGLSPTWLVNSDGITTMNYDSYRVRIGSYIIHHFLDEFPEHFSSVRDRKDVLKSYHKGYVDRVRAMNWRKE